MCGGSGGSGRKSGGGGSSTNGDAGQPGEVIREYNKATNKRTLNLANEAIKAKPKDLKTWSDRKLSNAIDAIRSHQHLDPMNRAEDRIGRERLRRF